MLHEPRNCQADSRFGGIGPDHAGGNRLQKNEPERQESRGHGRPGQKQAPVFPHQLHQARPAARQPTHETEKRAILVNAQQNAHQEHQGEIKVEEMDEIDIREHDLVHSRPQRLNRTRKNGESVLFTQAVPAAA